MADDKLVGVFAELVKAAVPPLALAERVANIIGIRGPDLDGYTQKWLVEEVVRLASLGQVHAARLDATARNALQLNAEDFLDLVTQTIVNYERTASRQKRRNMTNVLVNGMSADWSAGEPKFFARAVSELDTDHIEFLRRVRRGEQVSPQTGVDGAIELQLKPYRFFTGWDTDGSQEDYLVRMQRLTLLKITDLGERFLLSLEEPDEV